MIRQLVRGINALRRLPRTINKKTRAWIKVMRSPLQNNNGISGPAPKAVSDNEDIVLKTELENIYSEPGCSREIVNNQNAEEISVIEKNESLNDKLDDLQGTLNELKNKYLSEKMKKDSNHRADDLERELDLSTSERKYVQQHKENQEQDAGADIVAIGENLQWLKKRNTELRQRLEKTREPSARTIDDTESCPTYGTLVSEQCDRDGTSCSDDNGDFFVPRSCAEDDERIKGLQRKLNELEEAHTNKARDYTKIIAKIEIEARREKEFREEAHKSDMKLKENQVADIIEGFRIYTRIKNDEIEYHRGHLNDVTQKLKYQKTLLELEEAYARDRMGILYEKYDAEREKIADLLNQIGGQDTLSTANDRPLAAGKKPTKDKPETAAGKTLANGKPQTVVKKLASSSKSARPSGGAQREISVVRSPNVGPGNKTATRETKTSVTTSCSTNTGNRLANKLVKKDSKPRSGNRPLHEIFDQKQREREKRMNELHEKFQRKKASDDPTGGRT